MDEGKSEAGPGGVAGLLRSVESLEDAGLFLLAHPDAGVGNLGANILDRIELCNQIRADLSALFRLKRDFLINAQNIVSV